MKKSLPLAINSFEKIRSANYIYVDKTEHAYNLINKQTGYTYVFLSRPRRFGKSLFVDTLKQIFLGNKDLFKDLWIHGSDWKWDTHPIIHIDFSEFIKLDIDILKQNILEQLEKIASQYKVSLSGYTGISMKFSTLIKEVAKINSVVILIDEYDKPVLDNIQDIKKAEDMRDILKSFYEVIKANDPYIRFLFMTGVTKFSQMSIFSGLNNLNDISFDNQYSDITGYTQQELEDNFDDYLTETSSKLKLSSENLLTKIKKWYNGYRFSDLELTVYNPFSILNFFSKNKFSNYWIATGTPTFLIKLLKKQYPKFKQITSSMNMVDIFSSFDLERLSITPILYQSGYITILDYDPETRHYKLGYPNFEVEESFTKVILESLTNYDLEQVSSVGSELFYALRDNNFELFFEIIESFITGISGDLLIKQEIFFNAIFHSILKMVFNQVFSQLKQLTRRPDTVITMGNSIYIFELKLNKTAQDALDQVKQNKYYQPYTHEFENIYLIGVNFLLGKDFKIDYIVEKFK